MKIYKILVLGFYIFFKLMGMYGDPYKAKQKRDYEKEKVFEVANRLESLGGNPNIVEQIRKNA
ncbi:hypothetical protein pE33L466_0457 (plasmid) [Bacillus cereus E33L]|uniref:Uncharacterized protein n=1 Tax=Bacillus cereus (strain ZK / E33L) TaxID=288681 RepID=Q4V117_BACCZ|nr:hypothetical protein pE33L466_0457 [Bacillus cereus E33L]